MEQEQNKTEEATAEKKSFGSKLLRWLLTHLRPILELLLQHLSRKEKKD